MQQNLVTIGEETPTEHRRENTVIEQPPVEQITVLETPPTPPVEGITELPIILTEPPPAATTKKQAVKVVEKAPTTKPTDSRYLVTIAFSGEDATYMREYIQKRVQEGNAANEAQAFRQLIDFAANFWHYHNVITGLPPRIFVGFPDGLECKRLKDSIFKNVDINIPICK